MARRILNLTLVIGVQHLTHLWPTMAHMSLSPAAPAGAFMPR